MKTRFYNKLEIIGDKVVKTSAAERILREYDWYREASLISGINLPKFQLDESASGLKLELELIKGKNCYEYLFVSSKSNLELRKILLDARRIIEMMGTRTAKAHNFAADCEFMYLDKPIQSLDYFYKTDEEISTKVISINGRNCIAPKNILPELYDRFSHMLASNREYQFIHGDLTLSNMIKTTSGLYLIDPRGGFGATINFGPAAYDVAKLYFSTMSSFDSFNHHKFKIARPKEGAYTFEIGPIADPQPTDEIFFSIFKYDRLLIKFINATIWLSLFPHLQESKEQSLVAYLQGTLLLNEIYSESR